MTLLGLPCGAGGGGGNYFANGSNPIHQGAGGDSSAGDGAEQPSSLAATSGAANRGGGGGGGTVGYTGEAGGSGRVILRYPDTNPAASATTGSPTITVSGGYRTYDFTGSGSITF